MNRSRRAVGVACRDRTAEETSSRRESVETDGRWHLLLNRQIPVFTFFASNAVVNWQRAHGGRSSYKARRPQPDPTTTGILPLVASLARGTVLRCLYGVLCYSVYVPIFLYVDSAYRVSPCSLWENRRKQTRLSSHHSLPIRSFASLSPSLPLHPLSQQHAVRSIGSSRDFQEFFFLLPIWRRPIRTAFAVSRFENALSLAILSFLLAILATRGNRQGGIRAFFSKLFLGPEIERIDTRTRTRARTGYPDEISTR